MPCWRPSTGIAMPAWASLSTAMICSSVCRFRIMAPSLSWLPPVELITAPANFPAHGLVFGGKVMKHAVISWAAVNSILLLNVWRVGSKPICNELGLRPFRSRMTFSLSKCVWMPQRERTPDRLSEKGLLELGHNRVVITDQDGLEREACPCYPLAKQSVEEYISALLELSKSHSHSQPS